MKRYAKKVAKKAQARASRGPRRELESDHPAPRHVGAPAVELEGSAGGRLVAAVRGAEAGWEAEPLLRALSHPGPRQTDRDHRPNHAGKSTLLALLAARSSRWRGRSTGRCGGGVAAGRRRAAAGRPGRHARGARHAHVPEGEARRLLGHFGLEGDAGAATARRLVGRAGADGDRGDGREGRAPARRADQPPRLPVARRARVGASRLPGAIVAVSYDRASSMIAPSGGRAAGGEVVEDEALPASGRRVDADVSAVRAT